MERQETPREARLKQFKPGTGEKKTIFGWTTIRKRVRKLTRASRADRCVSNCQTGRDLKPSSDGRRISDAEAGWRERSTRFEPASQHSQLPLLRTRGLSSKSTFDACVCITLIDRIFASLFSKPTHALGPVISSGRTHSSNCSFVNNFSISADSRKVMPFS